MTVDEKIERLAGNVETNAHAIAPHDDKIEAHDRQVEALITIAEQQSKKMELLQKEWQAYLRTLRPE